MRVLRNLEQMLGQIVPTPEPAVLGELRTLGETTRRGLDLKGSERKRAIADVVDAFGVGTGGAVASNVSAQSLTGTWKLLLATEQETQFIVRNAGLFGTTAEVFQTIDVRSGRLQNSIRFGSGAAFIVDSSLTLNTASGRASFEFYSARLVLASGKAISLPPVGKGWFDSLYIKGGERLAYDSRGDILLVERAGAPDFLA